MLWEAVASVRILQRCKTLPAGGPRSYFQILMASLRAAPRPEARSKLRLLSGSVYGQRRRDLADERLAATCAVRGRETRLLGEWLGHRNLQNTALYADGVSARFRGMWD